MLNTCIEQKDDSPKEYFEYMIDNSREKKRHRCNLWDWLGLPHQFISIIYEMEDLNFFFYYFIFRH